MCWMNAALSGPSNSQFPSQGIRRAHAQRATFWKQSCGLGTCGWGTCIATEAFMSQHGKVMCGSPFENGGIIRHYSIIGVCIIYNFFPSITAGFHVCLEETQQNETVAVSADMEVFGSLHELLKTSFLKKALSRWLPFTFAKHLSVTWGDHNPELASLVYTV